MAISGLPMSGGAIPGHGPGPGQLPGHLPDAPVPADEKMPIGGPGAAGAAGAVAKAKSANDATPNDGVDKGDGLSQFDPTLGDLPTLPASESILKGNTQNDFRAFTGQLTALKGLITQKGAGQQILLRAQQLAANPSQSVLAQVLAQPENAEVVAKLTTGITQNAEDIAKNVSPEMQPMLKQVVAAGQNALNGIAGGPGGKITVAQLANMLEASADYLICMATALNTQDGQQNKDFLGNMLSSSQALEVGKQAQINQVMTQSAEKNQATKDEQAAADRNKFWNIVLAVVMIVVAVVMAVLSIFTCGGTGALAVLAVIAAVAACTMAVITVVQQLPTILEACGVNCDGFKALLAGPFGKFLTVLSYVCMACELLYAGVGLAASLSSTVSGIVGQTAAQVSANAARAGAQAAAPAVQGAVQGGATLGDSAAAGQGLAADAIRSSFNAAGEDVSEDAVQNMASTVTKGLATSFSNGGSVTTAVTAATKAATQSAAISVLSYSAQGLSIGAKIAGGAAQMSQAQIDFEIANLTADVQALQGQLKLLQTELQGQQDQSKRVQDELKDVTEQAQSIMEKLFAAMNDQSDIVQAVNNFGKR